MRKFPTGRLLAAALLAVLAVLTAIQAGWPREQVTMAGIVALAAVLWVTEALPVFATAIVVIAAEILLLTDFSGEGRWAFASGPAPGLRALLAAVADPVLLLFFSGFLLAKAAAKERVDLVFGGWLLRPFAARPSSLVIGVIAVTGLFSMWMSNTATTVFMLAILAPILTQVPPDAVWRKGLLLAVPFAANVAGMSTPISSPPNAIALGYLTRSGHGVSFGGWMLVGVPLTLVMLAVLAFILLRLFRPPPEATIRLADPGRLSPRGIVTVAAFAVTVCVWITEAWHGIPASTAALLPVTTLLVAGVVGRDEVNSLDWDVLILIAGGLALGWGISVTGLDQRIAGWLPAGAAGSTWLLAALVSMTLVLSTFLSNTAVANLFLPVGLAAAGISGHLPIAMAIAMAASLTMALPISTPPNAIAYARGELRTRDMVLPGALAGLVGGALVLGVMLVLARWQG